MVDSCLQEWNELETEFVQLQVSSHFGGADGKLRHPCDLVLRGTTDFAPR